MRENSVAVIGQRTSVLGFRALGLDTYPADTVEEANKWIAQLAEHGCAVIYLTETLAKDLPQTLERWKDALRPAIILIPGCEGSLGIGKEQIGTAIRRAIGTDIL